MRALPVFDCAALFGALDAQRRDHGLDWSGLADELWPQSAELDVTNLRTARFADTDLAMRVTQWLGRPAATFVHPARW